MSVEHEIRRYKFVVAATDSSLTYVALKMKLITYLSALLLPSFTIGAASEKVPNTNDGVQAAANGTFSWNRTDFLVNGKAYQIAGGQIDPQRVPRAYWAQRIQMAKAMGLNTIFSYVYWQDIEKYPDQFDFTDRNDIAAWFQEVEKAGMKAILRPGPYVCAERDWGGLPGWLATRSGMKIRSNNQPFLEASSKYLAKVAAQLQPLLITNGGPILMIQIENEYGYL
jgi:beta-galactosidase GanA